MIRDMVGMGILGGAAEGVLAQAHDPSEQELTAGVKGRLGESRLEFLDNRFKRQ
jgi:hypothetical protein